MREADDVCIEQAQVWVDTMGGATRKAGDIVQPMASGVLQRDDIRGDLFALTALPKTPVRDPGAITLFKSVGHALEGLAAAQLVLSATPFPWRKP